MNSVKRKNQMNIIKKKTDTKMKSHISSRITKKNTYKITLNPNCQIKLIDKIFFGIYRKIK